MNKLPNLTGLLCLLVFLCASTSVRSDSYLARGALANKDYPEARRWYEKLDLQGDSEAAFVLGLMYRNGWGVARDSGQANAYFRSAQDRGHIEAVYWLCKDNFNLARTKSEYDAVADLCGLVARQKSYRTTRGYIYEPDHVSLSYFVAGNALIKSGNEKSAALCLTKAHSILKVRDRHNDKVREIEKWAGSRAGAWYVGNWKQDRPWDKYGALDKIPPCMVTIAYLTANLHNLVLAGGFKNLGLK